MFLHTAIPKMFYCSFIEIRQFHFEILIRHIGTILNFKILTANFHSAPHKTYNIEHHMDPQRQ